MKFCAYCGTTRAKFLKTGKLGCATCYESLITSKELYKYTNSSKQVLDKLYNLNLNSHSFRKALEFLLSSGISIRVRYARNLKNFPFQVTSLFMDEFFQITQKIFSKYFSFQSYTFHYQNEFLYLRLFDEDHFRIYCYPRSILELIHFFKIIRELDAFNLFAFHETYKFLTACPTNSSLGNKLSISIELHKTIEFQLFQSKWMSLDHSYIDLEKKQKVNFYIKNFYIQDLQRFLKFWEEFIKSKTSYYK